MSWKKLLESTKESLNDHMRLRNAYLAAKNRILRRQIEGRVQLTDSERKELAEMGAKLGKKALSEIAIIAKPETILARSRKFASQQVDTAQRPKSVGRPRVDQEIEAWVICMARENRPWGYDRIQGSLKHLGYTISDQSVGNILKRHGIPPASERQRTVPWREFIRSHWDILMATGFFNSEVWSLLSLTISCLLFVLHFCYCQFRSLGVLLQRPIQVIPSFVRVFHDLRVHAHHEIDRAKKRFQVMRSRDLSSEITVSALVSCLEGGIPSQDQGRVLVLPSVHPLAIRDGPMRCVQPSHDLWQANERQAAWIGA